VKTSATVDDQFGIERASRPRRRFRVYGVIRQCNFLTPLYLIFCRKCLHVIQKFRDASQIAVSLWQLRSSVCAIRETICAR